MLKLDSSGHIPISPPRASASRVRDTLGGCPLRNLLDKMYETGIRYGWNIVGTAIHSAIEHVALDDLDLDQAIDHAHDLAWEDVKRYKKAGYEIRYANGRGMDTIDENIEDMLKRWWAEVHPDSSERHFSYLPYKWPFTPEVEISYPGFHTAIDAVFYAKKGPGVALVDWKTGTSKAASTSQMWTYIWAFEEWYPYAEVVDSWFHHLGHDEQIQPVEDFPGHEYVAHLVEYSEIVESNLTLRTLARPHWVCTRADLCPHKERCPAFGGDLRQIREDAKLLLVTEEPKEA